eukprot:GHUV01054698.1.p1 GENE.GHUV01054698.1~~GHUV01054698.1.p1  ORF type:complete len:121 (-),score=4.47 GHUV01054698.1:297-659(-)
MFISQMCRAIPLGKVSTYGDMAKALGSSARAVGQVRCMHNLLYSRATASMQHALVAIVSLLTVLWVAARRSIQNFATTDSHTAIRYLLVDEQGFSLASLLAYQLTSLSFSGCSSCCLLFP